MPDPNPTRLNRIACDLYTQHTRTSGVLSTVHERFSDALNAAALDFLLLRDVSTCTLTADAGVNAAATSGVVRRDRVVLAVPRQQPAMGELRAPQHQDKRRVEAIIQAPPFVVRGILHQAASLSLLQAVQEQDRRYLPVTNARVTHTTNQEFSFTAPFLLLNRASVDVLLETAQVRDGAVPSEADRVRPAVEAEAASIAALLRRSAVFESVPQEALEETCAQMIANGSLLRLGVPAGAELFRQGDADRSICVVETGELAVERSTPLNRAARQLATLGPGDVAGEMALLGDGRRTSTVRAVHDTVVLRIDAAAARLLMNQFPSTARSLLRLMLEREGSLEPERAAAAEAARIGRAMPYRLRPAAPAVAAR